MRLTVVSLLTLFSTTAIGATLEVGSGETYSTIQAAVNAASTGDVIAVHGGTYNERILINDSGITDLTIKAYDTSRVIINGGTLGFNTIKATNTDLTLVDLKIIAPDNGLGTNPNSIRMISDATGSAEVVLTACDLDLENHDLSSSSGVRCVVGTSDTVTIQGDNVSYTDLNSEVSGSCSFSGTWDDNPDVCSGL